MLGAREPEEVFNGNVYITRLKVPGGWIVTTMHLLHQVMNSVFVEDIDHSWELNNAVKQVEIGNGTERIPT